MPQNTDSRGLAPGSHQSIPNKNGVIMNQGGPRDAQQHKSDYTYSKDNSGDRSIFQQAHGLGTQPQDFALGRQVLNYERDRPLNFNGQNETAPTNGNNNNNKYSSDRGGK